MEEKFSLDEDQIKVDRLGLGGQSNAAFEKLSSTAKAVTGEGNDGGLDGGDGDGTDGDGSDGDSTDGDGDGTDGRI